MEHRSDTDKAIRNIMNWADRPEWSTERANVFDAHLAPVCKPIGISQEDLGREIAERGYWDMLFGVMFEDFLSRHPPSNARNVIDDYLARRGWRESVPGRRYLEQLRDSVFSLYEVVEVSPGHHCDVRDVVRGGNTVHVYEHMGTQNLVKWDRIAARVLNMNGKHIFSGGILLFPPEAAQRLLRILNESRKRFNHEFPHVLAEASKAGMETSDRVHELFLAASCPAFTSIWLIDTLERLRAPLPEMVNSDGEALMFTETRFPFLAGKRDEIAARLDTAAEWVRDEPEGHTWTWLPEPDASGKKSARRGIAIETFRDGRYPIGGTLKLKPGVLTLSTNSAERAERGRKVLEALLQGLIGAALSTQQTPEQLLAEHKTKPASDGRKKTRNVIDPEIAAEIIRDTLDQHYRRCLDEPIPSLDNKTPRQCVRSEKGREKVIEWLKHLENNELRRSAREGKKPYDSRWMWDELNLAKYLDVE